MRSQICPSVVLVGFGLAVLLILGCSGERAQVGLFEISGTVTGAVAEGVTVTLRGAADAVTTTDAQGHYVFTSLADGAYLIEPSLAGYTFDPADGLWVTIAEASLNGVSFVAWKEVDAGTWVKIEPGTFTMGSPDGELGREDDEVPHEVTLTRGFVMLATEVTQAEFKKRMGYDPPTDLSSCATCPVETVDWHEAAAYCNALSAAVGRVGCYTCTGTSPYVTCELGSDYETPYDCLGYRLPTEAEWEYAARAGDQRATYNGELTATDCMDTTLSSIAWFCGNADDTTHEVGQKTANDWGLYDMLGNVWEWCHDWYGTYGGDATDPSGPPTGSDRVFRGGSWDRDAWFARAAVRDHDNPGYGNYYLGLRPVRSLP
jgi:formylglycine-generating enzyme required for sulfatase activity